MITTEEYINRHLANIGNRLTQLRKAKGFSNYEQFAFTHEIARAQYGRYENGEDLRMSSLLRVLKAMDITPAEFFSEGFELEEGE